VVLGGAVATLAAVAALNAQEKAALVVVSGLPAPRGVGGVFVHRTTRHLRRPQGALVFVDQEGGDVRAFRDAPPALPPRRLPDAQAAFVEGRSTARALRARGAHADLAPVLDLADGPLGSRHFRTPAIGVAFAKGLAAGGVAACVKHFPGLGSAPVSTDDRTNVRARVRAHEVGAFAAAVRAGVPCVMTSHAFYVNGGRGRASLSPWTYRRLRALGFRGVAITDSLSFFRAVPVERWAPRAARAGADMLLFTSPAYARRAIRALVPLARRGELDAAAARVLRFRADYLSRRLDRARGSAH
jgi:beta-N-acetylhexosaminidase